MDSLQAWLEQRDVVRNSFLVLFFGILVLQLLHVLGLFSLFASRYFGVVMLASAALYLLIVQSKGSKSRVNRKWLFLVLGASFLIHLIPQLIHWPVVLGYDPGLYKFAFEHPFAEQWVASAYPLPFTALFGLLTAVFGWGFTGVPLHLLLWVALSGVAFWSARQLFDSDLAGLFAAVLVAISSAQYVAFWHFYYKNIFGLLGLLVGLVYASRARGFDWRVVAVGAFLFGMHRPATLLFGVVVGVGALRELYLREFRAAAGWSVSGVLIVAAGLLLNFDRITSFLLPGFSATVASLSGGGGGGTFLTGSAYISSSLWFLPFAFVGVVLAWRRSWPLTASFGGAFSIAVFSLFFNDRFLIYLDVLALLFAAFCLAIVWSTSKVGKVVASAALVVGVVVLVSTIASWSPLLTQDQFDAISAIPDVVSEDTSVIATSGHFAPWVKGWAERPVIAPGLFDDSVHNRQWWRQFLSGNQQAQFLSQYEGPVVVFSPQENASVVNNDCWVEIADMLYEPVC